MGESPALWMFVLVNLIVFLMGSLLTGLSYFAYRARPASPVFRISTVGFALITVGGLVEPIYMFGIEGEFDISGRELFIVQGIEAIVVALGLGLLFYSIKRFDPPQKMTRIVTETEANHWDK